MPRFHLARRASGWKETVREPDEIKPDGAAGPLPEQLQLATGASVHEGEFDRLPVPLRVSDETGSLTGVNQAWVRLTGRAPERELGLDWTESIHPDDLAQCLDGLREALTSLRPACLHYRLRGADGAYRTVIEHALPRHDFAGNVIGFLHATLEFGGGTTDPVQVRQRLDGQTGAQQSFRHRVSNRLQSVVSLLNLRAREAVDPEVRLELEATAALIEMVPMGDEDFADAAGLIRLDNSLRRLVDAFEPVMASRNVEFASELGPLTVPEMTEFPVIMAVHELLTNALKHAFADAQRGRVRLRAIRLGDRLHVEVADDGVGLPEWLEPVEGGGLRLVQELVRQVAGTLEVSRGRGTTIALSVPLWTDQPGA